MPMTMWEDIVGHLCDECEGPATHFYGNTTICCECHAGPGEGLVSRKEAECIHVFYESYGRLPEHGECD